MNAVAAAGQRVALFDTLDSVTAVIVRYDLAMPVGPVPDHRVATLMRDMYFGDSHGRPIAFPPPAETPASVAHCRQIYMAFTHAAVTVTLDNGWDLHDPLVASAYTHAWHRGLFKFVEARLVHLRGVPTDTKRIPMLQWHTILIDILGKAVFEHDLVAYIASLHADRADAAARAPRADARTTKPYGKPATGARPSAMPAPVSSQQHAASFSGPARAAAAAPAARPRYGTLQTTSVGSVRVPPSVSFADNVVHVFTAGSPDEWSPYDVQVGVGDAHNSLLMDARLDTGADVSVVAATALEEAESNGTAVTRTSCSYQVVGIGTEPVPVTEAAAFTTSLEGRPLHVHALVLSPTYERCMGPGRALLLGDPELRTEVGRTAVIHCLHRATDAPTPHPLAGYFA
jgi:hypothetical protein